MKRTPYYFEQEDLLRLFVSALDDIIIDRHDGNRKLHDKIEVGVVLAGKQKVMHDITNKDHKIVFPVVAVSKTSMSYTPNRLFNKYLGFNETTVLEIEDPITGDKITIPKGVHFETPLPIEMEVTVTMFAKFQSDLDKIESNILTFFSPYIVIANKLPDEYRTKDIHEIRHRVEWDGTINFNEVSYDADAKVRFEGTTTFKINGLLFKDKPIRSNIIHKVGVNYYSINDCDIKRPQSELTTYAQNKETFTIEGKPEMLSILINDKFQQRYNQKPWTNPISVERSGANVNIIIQGEGMDFVQKVLMTSNNISETKLTASAYTIKGVIISNAIELPTDIKVLNTNALVLSFPMTLLNNQTSFKLHLINPAGISESDTIQINA